MCHGAVELLSLQVLSWPLWVKVECPPPVHQKLLTGDQSDTAGLLLVPLGFHFCK